MAARTYITKSGDRWDGISKEIYGSEAFSYVLMQANPALIDYLQFDSGVMLTVPELTDQDIESNDLPAWRKDD